MPNCMKLTVLNIGNQVNLFFHQNKSSLFRGDAISSSDSSYKKKLQIFSYMDIIVCLYFVRNIMMKKYKICPQNKLGLNGFYYYY